MTLKFGSQVALKMPTILICRWLPQIGDTRKHFVHTSLLLILLLERRHHLTGHCVDVPILGLLLGDIVDIVHILADKRNQLESHSCIIAKRFSDMCFCMYCFDSVLTRQMRWLLTIMWKFHRFS